MVTCYANFPSIQDRLKTPDQIQDLASRFMEGSLPLKACGTRGGGHVATTLKF